MIIVRKSPVTGKMNYRRIDITDVQYLDWESGQVIQDVMPDISPEDREFIISGCTPEDFDTMYPEED